ncbi:MAG: hypothetical protein ACE15B_14045 [Bryobacteraceae bacterium]
MVFALSFAASLMAVDKQLAGQAQTAAAAAGPRDWQPRPIPMGVSIGNTPSLPYIYAGTAGLLVHSFSNPSLKFILSNNHVLGAKGPNLCPNTATVGTWSLQPGTLDIGNDPGNDPYYVAGVVAGFLPLTSGYNIIDAALSFTTTSLASSTILGIGQPGASLGFPSPGQAVIKSGRTTGVTNGTVDSVNVTVTVNYGSSCGTYTFLGQIMITPGTFSAGGDSGSAILDAATRSPVGLLFAGSSTYTVANTMYWVYRIFRVTHDAPGAAIASTEDLDRAHELWTRTADPRIAHLKEVQGRHERDLLSRPGVHAVGIGKHENGRDFVLKVYGRGAAGLPPQVEGVPVRMVDSGGPFTAR